MGDLGSGSDPGAWDRADQRVVRRVSGQGIGLRRVRGVRERCPFDVEIIAKMREAAKLLEEPAA